MPKDTQLGVVGPEFELRQSGPRELLQAFLALTQGPQQCRACRWGLEERMVAGTQDWVIPTSGIMESEQFRPKVSSLGWED